MEETKTKEIKNKLYNVELLICFLLIFACIPFGWFIKDKQIVFYLQCGMKIAFLVLCYFFSKKHNLPKLSFSKCGVKDLLFIPILLISCSNFIYVFIRKSLPNETIDKQAIIADGIYYLLVAISEEIVFRNMLENTLLSYKRKIVAILYSSLAFGLVHLLNINSLASIIPCIIQSIYTFVLGLIVGFVFSYKNNIIYPILIHFCFNFINDSLVTNLYNYQWDLLYYIVSIAIGIIVLLYCLILFLNFYKKELEGQNNVA